MFQGKEETRQRLLHQSGASSDGKQQHSGAATEPVDTEPTVHICCHQGYTQCKVQHCCTYNTDALECNDKETRLTVRWVDNQAASPETEQTTRPGPQTKGRNTQTGMCQSKKQVCAVERTVETREDERTSAG